MYIKSDALVGTEAILAGLDKKLGAGKPTAASIRTKDLAHRIATERRTPIVWRGEDLPEPAFTGTRIIEPDLAELRPYIDWTFFFSAWELKGRFPPILHHPRHGQAARQPFRAPTGCTATGPPRWPPARADSA